MTREEIYREMEDTFGTVPVGYKKIPNRYLESEWEWWKSLMNDTAVPLRWKALIGLGISSGLQDEFDILFYTEVARMFGASEEEIQHVSYLTKVIAGWQPYLKSCGVSYDEFKHEMPGIIERMKLSESTIIGKCDEKASI